MTLTHLSDDQLVTSLDALCVDARRLDARLIAHLVEVEDRRLHLQAACSSMFDFCVRRLHMSEGAAFRRINAARLVRRFPALLAHVERGEVHLSTLVLLRDHLTESNLDDLVLATARKTKREVEELLAQRAPRPDVPTTIRRLPAAKGGSAPAALPPASLHHAVAPASIVTPRPAARIEPLSESRHKVQLTVSTELRAKLERARDLMRHRNPSGDLAVVVEQALDALLDKLEKERLAKTNSPRRASIRTTKKGRVTAAVRREVFARDGGQCTFLDRQGHRCPSRAFLELDHVESRALGGDDDVDNLRVRCRAHNQLHAEEVFGREHVARMIHFRQRKSDVPGDGLSQSAFGMGPSSGGVSWPRPAPPAEPME
jgi:hypothetical protein